MNLKWQLFFHQFYICHPFFQRDEDSYRRVARSDSHRMDDSHLPYDDYKKPDAAEGKYLNLDRRKCNLIFQRL